MLQGPFFQAVKCHFIRETMGKGEFRVRMEFKEFKDLMVSQVQKEKLVFKAIR